MRSTYYCRLSDEERKMRKARYEQTRTEYFRERYRNMPQEKKDEINRARMARRTIRPRAKDPAWEKVMANARKEARATGQRLSDIMFRMGLPQEKVQQYRGWGR